MIDQASVPSLMGSTVRDNAGEKIGKVGQVYLDDTTGQPEWVTVRTGLFGTKESFVPLAAARVEGDEIVVDIPKSRVSDAPKIDEDGHLSEEQETELYTYYGVSQGPFGRQAMTQDADYGGTGGQAGLATDYDRIDEPAGMAGADYDTGDRRTGLAADADPTGTPVGDADVAEATSGAGYGETAVPGGPEHAGPDFARGEDASVTGAPSSGAPDFARGEDGTVTGEPSPGRPDFARGTDRETGLVPDADAERAAAGVVDDEAGGTRRRLRRWQITDEVTEVPVVDESGAVIGEVRDEQVEIRPDDERR